MRLSTILVAALLLFAAFGLATARPLGWGSAAPVDDTRYKVSPIGLSHVLQPHQPVSPTRDCRWSPPAGDAELCAAATGGAAAFRALRLVPRLVDLAVVLCLISAALVFVLRPSLSKLRSPILAAAVLSALAAPVVFAISAPRALAVLQGLDFGVGGTRGTLQVAIAAALLAGLAAANVVTPAPGRTPAGQRTRWIGGATLVLLPVLGFLAMFPAPGALAFAAASTAIGAGAGWQRARIDT